MIYCACGCGKLISERGKNGKKRKYEYNLFKRRSLWTGINLY